MNRGLYVHAGVMFAVDGNQLQKIDSVGVTTQVGTINSIAGNIDFASNLTQLFVTDGSYLYVYTPASGNFQTATNYPGSDRITFLAQRIAFVYRGTQQLGWTGLGSESIDILDFASAEDSPDKLVAVVAFEDELYLLGEESTEVWGTAPNSDQPFSKTSAAMDYGCVAPHSAQATAKALYWMGRAKNGSPVVLRTSGHQAQVVSTRAEEEKFAGRDCSNAKAFTESIGKQSFYCLKVPGLVTTLVYDELTGTWHERAEWVAGEYKPWRPDSHAYGYGRHYYGTKTGIYIGDPDEHTYGGDVKRRQRIAPVISKPDGSRVFYPLLEILCAQGGGGQAMLRYSDDNGANWSGWRYADLGATGQYAARLQWRRLGTAYNRVFDVVVTDPVPFNPVQLYLQPK